MYIFADESTCIHSMIVSCIIEQGLCIPCNMWASLFYTTLSLPPSEKKKKRKDAWLCTALQFYESQEAVGPGILSQTQAKAAAWLYLYSMACALRINSNTDNGSQFCTGERIWIPLDRYWQENLFCWSPFQSPELAGAVILSLKPKRSCVKVACISA